MGVKLPECARTLSQGLDHLSGQQEHHTTGGAWKVACWQEIQASGCEMFSHCRPHQEGHALSCALPNQ